MKYILLGASRGLGLEVSQVLSAGGHQVFNFSRSSSPKMDFSKIELASSYLEGWAELKAERIIYFAGGGPFGPFAKKEFKDHQWAYAVNFIFPSWLLHMVLTDSRFIGNLKQICFIGSAVAGTKPDPGAASYAAGKQGLRGLLTSVQQEPHGDLDIRLFSPGYLDTAMLPPNAWPRQGGGLVKSPAVVAQALLEWLESVDSVNQEKLFE